MCSILLLPSVITEGTLSNSVFVFNQRQLSSFGLYRFNAKARPTICLATRIAMCGDN